VHEILGKSRLESVDDFNRAALILYTGQTKIVLYDEYERLVQGLETDILRTQPPVQQQHEPQPVKITVDLIADTTDRVSSETSSSLSKDHSELLDLKEFLEVLNIKATPVGSLGRLCNLLQASSPQFSPAICYRLERLLDRLFSRVECLVPGLPACVVGYYSGFDWLYEFVVNKRDVCEHHLPKSLKEVIGCIRLHVLSSLALAVYDLTTVRTVMREYLQHRSALPPPRPDFRMLVRITTTESVISFLTNSYSSGHRNWSLGH
jgi:hypothetical protein